MIIFMLLFFITVFVLFLFLTIKTEEWANKTIKDFAGTIKLNIQEGKQLFDTLKDVTGVDNAKLVVGAASHLAMPSLNSVKVTKDDEKKIRYINIKRGGINQSSVLALVLYKLHCIRLTDNSRLLNFLISDRVVAGAVSLGAVISFLGFWKAILISVAVVLIKVLYEKQAIYAAKTFLEDDQLKARNFDMIFAMLETLKYKEKMSIMHCITKLALVISVSLGFYLLGQFIFNFI